MMSSRRKISLWLYREWMMRRSSSRTSAWKPWVSRAPAAGVSVVDAMGEFRVSFGQRQSGDHGNRHGIFKRRVRRGPAAGRG